MKTNPLQILSLLTAITLISACGSSQDVSSETQAAICRVGCDAPIGPVLKRAPNLKVRLISSDCSQQKAVFEVYNSGVLNASATVARATFDGGYPRDFSIPPLAVGARYQVSTSLYFPGGDLSAEFKADATNAVTEQSESDNSASLFCIG